MNTKYEQHYYINPDFPIFFHLDSLTRAKSYFHVHWHEHIEILYITEGECTINGNGIDLSAKPGDVVMITPNCVHYVRTANELCRYYCITVDKSFCDRMRVPMCGEQFAMCMKNEQIRECYDSIIGIMSGKPKYYLEEAKTLILRLLVLCCRDAGDADIYGNGCISKPVSQTVEYINAHFTEPLSADKLALELGYSKYYICRVFRRETGRTVVEYINFLRCANAKRLIKSGQYNVGESARLSGFSNLSYFTRTYKSQMGRLPSDEQVK